MMNGSFPMNGGEGTYSYTNNSTLQRDAAIGVKDAIKEAVINNLEIDKLLASWSSSSSSFVIADLGCSTGPNTFYAVQTLIEAVQHNHTNNIQECKGTGNNLEFQVMFNDQIGNDFNTLFASLPHPTNYFAAGVPGSFHTRLFPSSSIHIAYSSSAVNWLSRVPEELQVRESPAWNAGRIHCEGASQAVVEAYEKQFEKDMEVFLRVRSEEIARGGMMVIVMLGVAHRDVQHYGCKVYSFLESILMDMVKEGVVEQEQVDTFNIPTIFPCIKELRSVVEKNECLEIVKMEVMDVMAKSNAETTIMHLRAAAEATLSSHFGKEIVELLFERAMQNKLSLDSYSELGSTTLLFTALKRK